MILVIKRSEAGDSILMNDIAISGSKIPEESKGNRLVYKISDDEVYKAIKSENHDSVPFDAWDIYTKCNENILAASHVCRVLISELPSSSSYWNQVKYYIENEI